MAQEPSRMSLRGPFGVPAHRETPQTHLHCHLIKCRGSLEGPGYPIYPTGEYTTAPRVRHARAKGPVDLPPAPCGYDLGPPAEIPKVPPGYLNGQKHID